MLFSSRVGGEMLICDMDVPSDSEDEKEAVEASEVDSDILSAASVREMVKQQLRRELTSRCVGIVIEEAMLEEQVKDARSVADKEREAALARAKELAVERVKRQALRAEENQRARLQAVEDVAQARKAEVDKEKRLAAREAAGGDEVRERN